MQVMIYVAKSTEPNMGRVMVSAYDSFGDILVNDCWSHVHYDLWLCELIRKVIDKIGSERVKELECSCATANEFAAELINAIGVEEKDV